MPISDALVQQRKSDRLEKATALNRSPPTTADATESTAPHQALWRAPSSAHRHSRIGWQPLRHEKDFVGVGVFYFGAWRKPANIDVALVRCVWAGHKSGLIRNRNTVRQIAFSRPRCRGGRGLWLRVFFCRLRWRGRLVWIVGLGCRLFWCAWITRHVMTHWRLVIPA